MQTGLKKSYEKDLIQRVDSGEIDLKRMMRIIDEISAESLMKPNQHILLDFRGTKIAIFNMNAILMVTSKFTQMMPMFKNKIAMLIPNDPYRIAVEEKLQACMILNDINYKFFCEYEEAIEWLSDTR